MAGSFEKKSAEDEAAGTDSRFTSELAMEIVEQLYPLLLENCTDDEDAVDTTAMMESLAALIGLFAADYHEQFGQKKSMDMVKEMVDLALALYKDRTEEPEEG